MNERPETNDLLSVAAAAVMATCAVMVAHETLGHGGMCLALGGRITEVTASMFHCSLKSDALDPAGPVMNLILSTVALGLQRWARTPALRLFLLLVTALSYGREGGYAVYAMIRQDGDLYFTVRSYFGGDLRFWRIVVGVAGLALYIASLRLTAAELVRLWPRAAEARRVARTAGIAALLAALAAGLAYAGHNPRNLHDAVLEIAAGAVPLLLIPRQDGEVAPGVRIHRHLGLVVAAVAVFALFLATQGRGVAIG